MPPISATSCFAAAPSSPRATSWRSGCRCSSFLLISGGDAGAFLRASRQSRRPFPGRPISQGRQIGFLDEFKFVLIGVATLVVIWRLPRFINDLERELSGEKL
jgi:hypothetical protein